MRAAEALARGDKVKKQRGIYFENLDAFRKIHLEPLGSRKDYEKAGKDRLTAVVVAKTGHMGRMNAILPVEFVERKRANISTTEPTNTPTTGPTSKRASERATGQASRQSEIVEVIEGLVREYLVGLVR